MPTKLQNLTLKKIFKKFKKLKNQWFSKKFLKRFAFERFFETKKTSSRQNAWGKFRKFRKIENMWILTRVSLKNNICLCKKYMFQANLHWTGFSIFFKKIIISAKRLKYATKNCSVLDKGNLSPPCFEIIEKLFLTKERNALVYETILHLKVKNKVQMWKFQDFELEKVEFSWQKSSKNDFLKLISQGIPRKMLKVRKISLKLPIEIPKLKQNSWISYSFWRFFSCLHWFWTDFLEK